MYLFNNDNRTAEEQTYSLVDSRRTYCLSIGAAPDMAHVLQTKQLIKMGESRTLRPSSKAQRATADKSRALITNQPTKTQAGNSLSD